MAASSVNKSQTQVVVSQKISIRNTNNQSNVTSTTTNITNSNNPKSNKENKMVNKKNENNTKVPVDAKKKKFGSPKRFRNNNVQIQVESNNHGISPNNSNNNTQSQQQPPPPPQSHSNKNHQMQGTRYLFQSSSRNIEKSPTYQAFNGGVNHQRDLYAPFVLPNQQQQQHHQQMFGNNSAYHYYNGKKLKYSQILTQGCSPTRTFQYQPNGYNRISPRWNNNHHHHQHQHNYRQRDGRDKGQNNANFEIPYPRNLENEGFFHIKTSNSSSAVAKSPRPVQSPPHSPTKCSSIATSPDSPSASSTSSRMSISSDHSNHQRQVSSVFRSVATAVPSVEVTPMLRTTREHFTVQQQQSTHNNDTWTTFAPYGQQGYEASPLFGKDGALDCNAIGFVSPYETKKR